MIKGVKGTAMALPAGIAMGTGVSLLITGGLSVVLTVLALSGKIAEGTIGYFTMGILLLSSITGSMLSAGKVKRRRLLVCIISGVAYFLVLLVCTAVFFGGNYRGVGVSGLVVMIGCLTAAVMGLKRSNSGHKNFKKYRTC
jgi:putative membrane protein (TIGR04086 family)